MAEFRRKTLTLSSGRQVKLYGNSAAKMNCSSDNMIGLIKNHLGKLATPSISHISNRKR